MKAFNVVIRFWTDNKRKHIAKDKGEAATLAESHVKHVSRLLAQGYGAGEITDEGLSGWWEIEDADEKPKPAKRARKTGSRAHAG